MKWLIFFAAVVLDLGSLPLCQTTWAQSHEVLREKRLPNDARLQPPEDVNGFFPFRPSNTLAEWERRAERVRRQALVSQGLWPMPSRSPLHAVIHGRIDRGDYTVEKVYFESCPGFYVTGSLYRPKGKSGKVPAVLSPHGHWENGRFYDAGEKEVRQDIIQGAERFEEGGRSMFQSVCVQLARMGCVVFQHDMIGYADSLQLSRTLAHEFTTQRPEMNTVENWGLFSPQAEMHLQSVMGLQTWDSIRALDFLFSLPEVDPERIGVTGASGGATQTLLLCAVDPRPAVAFPAVMVSTAMQGDCTCENACFLRIDTGNVELAALFAPKPLGLTAANDWTKEMPTKGFPELQALYAMMGAPERVMLKPLLHFDHNYNYVSRAVVYQWFNRYLKLGWQEPIIEQDYRRLSPLELTVWDQNHPKPDGGPEFERKLLRYLTEDGARQIQQARDSLPNYREMVGGAIDILIGRSLAEVGEVGFTPSRKEDRGIYEEIGGLLRNQTHGEELPVIFLRPHQTSRRTVIWIDQRGKDGLFAGENLLSEVQRLLQSGACVVGVDLFLQGEFLNSKTPSLLMRRNPTPGEFAAFDFGYNHPLFAQRVHDILTVVKYASQGKQTNGSLILAGFEGAGPWVAAAVAQAREVVAAAALDTAGFRFGNILDLKDANFLPGGAKYGDLPGIIALGAPVKLWVSGETEQSSEVPRLMYEKAGAQDNLTLFKGDLQRRRESAIQWLLTNSRDE
jgi:dienelactone hydrolase